MISSTKTFWCFVFCFIKCFALQLCLMLKLRTSITLSWLMSSSFTQPSEWKVNAAHKESQSPPRPGDSIKAPWFCSDPTLTKSHLEKIALRRTDPEFGWKWEDSRCLMFATVASSHISFLCLWAQETVSLWLRGGVKLRNSKWLQKAIFGQQVRNYFFWMLTFQ